jgi:hypothetical protein
MELEAGRSPFFRSHNFVNIYLHVPCKSSCTVLKKQCVKLRTGFKCTRCVVPRAVKLSMLVFWVVTNVRG